MGALRGRHHGATRGGKRSASRRCGSRNSKGHGHRSHSSESSSKRPRLTPQSDGSVRLRRSGADGHGLHGIDDFAAMRALSSSSGNDHAGSAIREMEVYEWVGDAVIGELVARCLLSQFHRAPLAARVFRNLRLGAVTNQNLAMVFDHMGYQRQWIESRKRRVKEKADVVEAVAGELVVRLELQKRDAKLCSRLRDHLDCIMASMLQQHFAERCRINSRTALEGPLTVSFNVFNCLPQEHLDEESGALIIHDGRMEGLDAKIALDSGGIEFEQKSFADLIQEGELDGKKKRPSDEATFEAFHAFSTDQNKDTVEDGDWVAVLPDGVQAIFGTIRRRIRAQLNLLFSNHVLLQSREIFDVFKIYGMTVLAERVSLNLAFPYLSSRGSFRSTPVTPSSLTTQRQGVLCMSNLARCATVLGIDGSVSDESSSSREDIWTNQRLQANSLRSFIGFHSAVAAEDGSKSLADDVALLLHLLATTEESISPYFMYPTPMPRREPLSRLQTAVSEARKFMISSVCDDLHRPNERPKPTRLPSLLLRQCDSEQTENLFDTLAKQREQQQLKETHGDNADSDLFSRRRKRKRSEDKGDKTGKAVDYAKPTANLARFLHRRFLFCLEELVVLFAQRKIEDCRAKMASFETALEPCSGDFFRKWEVSTSTLTLAMRDSFYRLLLHDLCMFHALVSTSKNTRDGTRITQLRFPMHYTWSKVGRRVTTEEEAVS